MSRKKDDGRTPLQRMLQPLTLVTQLGYTMISPIGMGLLMGYYFDKWLDCSPWGILFFTIMGIGGAYKAAFASFGKYTRDPGEDKEDNDKK